MYVFLRDDKDINFTAFWRLLEKQPVMRNSFTVQEGLVLVELLLVLLVPQPGDTSLDVLAVGNITPPYRHSVTPQTLLRENT